MQDEARVTTLDGRTKSPVIRRDMSILEPLVVVKAPLFLRRPAGPLLLVLAFPAPGHKIVKPVLPALEPSGVKTSLWS